jgi:hypothetical protein
MTTTSPWRWKVYLVTCLVTGQQYVGMTKLPLLARWGRHISDAHLTDRSPARMRIAEAIREYGAENFTIEAIAYCIDEPAARAVDRRRNSPGSASRAAVIAASQAP